MLSRPAACRGCPLDKISQGFSRPVGTGALGVLVVAEALGEHEAREGYPLVPWAESGSMFQRALDKAGIDRDQLALWNIVACRPPSNKFENMPWEWGAAQHCRVHFNEVLERFRPRVILALGNTALKHLTGMTGKSRTVSSLRGYVLPSTRHPGILVVPTYHPSFLRRGATSLFRVFVQDILLAVEVAQGGGSYSLEPEPPPGFLLNPSEKDVRDLLERLRAQPELLLAYDIETDRSIAVDESELFKLEEDDDAEENDKENEEEARFDIQKALAGPIVQVQFSVGVGHALSIPFTERFVPTMREILGSSNPKIGHNCWRFDDPMLRLSGLRVNGQRSDTLWAWHHTQPDLPAHLQFVASQFGQPYPWKHLAGQDLAFYGACDVDVLHRIWNQLPDAMRAKSVKGWDDRCEIRSLFEGYKQHVEDLNPILEKMSERGIPVNREKLEEFGRDIDKLKDAAYLKLDEMYPVEIRKVASFYKRTPANTEGLVQRNVEFEDKEILHIRQECLCKKGCKKCDGTHFYTKQIRGDKRKVNRLVWCRLREFAPGFDQIGAYILYKGHAIPTRATKKGEGTNARQKVTTDKTALEQLYRKTGDEFYNLVIKYRNYDKLKNTYVKGWTPKGDERVHSSYIFRPATGQLSSVGPNVQNAIGSKAGELGIRFKNCIEARPGYLIGECDFTGLHAYMLGFLAGDKSYMRLASMGIHDFVAAHILNKELPRHIEELSNDKLTVKRREQKNEALTKVGLPTDRDGLCDLWDHVRSCDGWLNLPDDELAKRLDWVKGNAKVYRSKVKPAVHGYGFGIGAYKLWKTYPDSFQSSREAQDIINMLNNLFPIVAGYREQIKEQAHKQGFLMSPFGYIRYFHQVFDYRPVKADHEPQYGETLVRRRGRMYKKTGGQDAEKAIAYLPANCSFGVKKDALIALEREGLATRYGLINEVHDSFLFEFKEELKDEWVRDVLEVMQRPSPLLIGDLAPEGLSCRAAAAIGKSWGSMKEVH